MNSRIRKITIFILYLINLLALMCFYSNYINFKIVTILTTLSVMITLVELYKKKEGFILAYLIYLFLTNFGVYITNVFIENPLVEYHGDFSWYTKNFDLVFIIANVAILTFSIFSILISNIFQFNYSAKLDIKNFGNSTFYYAGIILIILFTIQFLYYIFSGKINVNTYQDYVSSIQEIKYYSFGVSMFSIGIAFSFANCSKENLKYIVSILALPILLFLITGNRGEVFYPLLSAVGVLIVRNFKIKKWMYFLSFLTFFLLFPLIKLTRNLSASNIQDLDIKWYSSLVEIGYTLRPLGYTVDWIQNGERLAYGESYFAPFQRMLSNIIPGMEKIDYMLVGYGFRYRLPGMGYSVVAEGYYNWGLIGVIFIMIIVCLVCVILNNMNSFTGLSFGTAILSILINNIRNAFSFVPQFIIIVGFLTVCLVLIHTFRNKLKKGT
ncbi:O-antigen polysaccharide polymerase Wzy [Mammaliicoccus sciuri]|uniref:O-antigen polysaccharide polymerase Wzy n=1 Tax=Mammaliicoccus sciuri TaxID=1296 RepID=UPI002DBFA9B5|nr:O-antigen polysaccharide polymerase Wzy [Mammaliicoccus sciuri]MEB6121382.1 O-antigen polysaccharide polymerase Wzy family protein [Mammaliicoccus sciuri]MEB6286905.1 O-antigen polysaccharide polymerase Wzy family protein [Mammaliicoccus sciuri]MEB6312365.1 O-antigen polysaccharide polymerase Wzy family protein [Mammaliicoccus sciuri]MEB6695169.1 O-antigen polysaccharide polymerase Wzy family protein [Mammaliicoccus sciuri]